MKRLLSLVAVVAIVAAMMPSTGIAGLRGAFEPIGRGEFGGNVDGILFGNGIPNGIQTLAQRPQPAPAGNGYALLERWYAFTTRSQVVGLETSREIWQAMNRAAPATLVDYIIDARRPLLQDLTGLVSYADPAWSPNGRFLAYVLTNSQVTEAAIWVQEYLVSNVMATSTTPVGAPFLVVSGAPVDSAGPSSRNRHPDWSPDGNSLAFDSDVSGTSIDIYTVQVFPTVGAPVKKTFVANRSEQNPSWNPDGVRICYDTNHFGPNIVEIVDTNTGAVTLAETNFAPISHNNPDWSSDGLSIYYDAPENEDPLGNPDIWKLDLATQAKCAIHLDGAGDVNVAASSHTNVTGGVTFNTIIFESQAFPFLGQPGLRSWRANPIQSCVPPLPMVVDMKPTTVNFDTNSDIGMELSFPDEVRNLGYVMSPNNIKGKDGVRFRSPVLGGFFPSPMVMGGISPNIGPSGLPYQSDNPGDEHVVCQLPRRTLLARIVALGMLDKIVPIQVDAYSNNAGRTFRGFGLLRVGSSSLAGSTVRLEQNAPNPFNPVTRIKFAVARAGNVSLRVYNVRGELVKTIVNQRFDQGQHEASWDGRNAGGQSVSSGVYYAKAVSEGGATDVIKMVMAK